MVLSMLLFPLWPAYGEALARGDAAWIRRTLGRSLSFTLAVAGVTAAAFVLAGNVIIAAWVGPSVTPSLGLLTGFAAWTVVASLGSTVSMLLNGAGADAVPGVDRLGHGSLPLPAKIGLGLAFGLPGVIWGTVLAYSLCSGVPLAIRIPSLLPEVVARAAHPAAGPASG